MYVVLVHVLSLSLIEWWSLLSEVGRVWSGGRRPPSHAVSYLCLVQLSHEALLSQR